jgi:hypothetical protein
MIEKTTKEKIIEVVENTLESLREETIPISDSDDGFIGNFIHAEDVEKHIEAIKKLISLL